MSFSIKKTPGGKFTMSVNGIKCPPFEPSQSAVVRLSMLASSVSGMFIKGSTGHSVKEISLRNGNSKITVSCRSSFGAPVQVTASIPMLETSAFGEIKTISGLVRSLYTSMLKSSIAINAEDSFAGTIIIEQEDARSASISIYDKKIAFVYAMTTGLADVTDMCAEALFKRKFSGQTKQLDTSPIGGSYTVTLTEEFDDEDFQNLPLLSLKIKKPE